MHTSCMIIDNKHFQNCISLGWFCGTANAMNHNGVRNFSSPFDWCFSNFDSVIKMIKNDFSDFMNINNLKISEDNHKAFIDFKYDFYFNHDVMENFQSEFSIIKEKYERRIKRFLEESQKNTCFFRAVRDEREIKYIVENYQQIFSVIKKNNINNEIIFLTTSNINFPKNFSGTFFNLNIDRYIGEQYPMYHMFDNNHELVVLCKKILPQTVTETNIKRHYETLDYKKKNSLFISALEHQNLQIYKIVNRYIDTKKGLYIYGGGDTEKD